MLSCVPQGSVLGLILFLIFINKLPDNIRSSVPLFTDDCVLYRNMYSIQDCLTLQEDLTSLGQWEADWQMKFNVAKCHSMRVTRHQHHKHILFDYSLHIQTLENVQSAKYLGITVSDNMDWGQHISEISTKTTKTLGFLRRNLAFAPKSTNLELFPIGMVFLHRWSIPRLLRSLGHSRKLLFFCFVFVFCFVLFFSSNFKFALPAVMIIFVRASTV